MLVLHFNTKDLRTSLTRPVTALSELLHFLRSLVTVEQITFVLKWLVF